MNRNEARLRAIERAALERLAGAQGVAMNAMRGAPSAQSIGADLSDVHNQFSRGTGALGHMNAVLNNAFGNNDDDAENIRHGLRLELAHSQGLPVALINRPSETGLPMPAGTGLMLPTGRHTARIAPAPAPAPAPNGPPAPKPKGWKNKIANFGKALVTRRAPKKPLLNVMDELTREQDKVQDQLIAISKKMRNVISNSNSKLQALNRSPAQEKNKQRKLLLKAKDERLNFLEKAAEAANEQLIAIQNALESLMNGAAGGGRRVTHKRRR